MLELAGGTNREQLRSTKRDPAGARLATATLLMDVTRKQRFGSGLNGITRDTPQGCAGVQAASFASRSGTHATCDTGIGARATGRSPLMTVLDSGEWRVKRTGCAKSTHGHPRIECEYFLFTGVLWVSGNDATTNFLRNSCPS